MSLLNCKIHGERGAMTNASKNICESIINSSPLPSDLIEIINVVNKENDGVVLFDENYIFTKREVDVLNLKKKYEIFNAVDERKLHNIIKNSLGIVCVECFKKYIKDNNIEFQL